MPRVKRSFFHSWDSESVAYMDYLHGTVDNDELEAACLYEYARESQLLRNAAQEYQRLIRENRLQRKACSNDPRLAVIFHRAAQDVLMTNSCSNAFAQLPWGEIWRCPSFPSKPWTLLEKRERSNVLGCIPTATTPPLGILPIVELDAMGVFEELLAMSTEIASKPTRTRTSKALPVLDARELSIRRLRRRIAALRNSQTSNPSVISDLEETLKAKLDSDKNQEGRFVHVMFTLDFSETKLRIRERLDKWLKLPENENRLQRYCCDPKGLTHIWKDRLKDLAVCRLFDEIGKVYNLNVFANSRRKRFTERVKRDGCTYRRGDFMPFHNARYTVGKKGERQAPNQSDLCKNELAITTARSNVRRFSREIRVP